MTVYCFSNKLTHTNRAKGSKDKQQKRIVYYDYVITYTLRITLYLNNRLFTKDKRAIFSLGET